MVSISVGGHRSDSWEECRSALCSRYDEKQPPEVGPRSRAPPAIGFVISTLYRPFLPVHHLHDYTLPPLTCLAPPTNGRNDAVQSSHGIIYLLQTEPYYIGRSIIGSNRFCDFPSLKPRALAPAPFSPLTVVHARHRLKPCGNLRHDHA